MTAASSTFPARAPAPPDRPLGRFTQAPLPTRLAVLAYGALAVIAACLGYAFGLFAQTRLALFIVPPASLALIALWVMPDLAKPPVRLLETLLMLFIVALLCWPDYLAIAPPGLPWITLVRLTGAPLFGVGLLCVFASRQLRATLADILRGDRATWMLLAAFIVISGLSVFVSSQFGYSLGKYLLAVWSWYAMVFIACVVFARPGAARRFALILLGVTVLCVAIALVEKSEGHVPWVGHIPAFLQIEDGRVKATLAGSERAANGIYRVQSKFYTSIGLGEFLGMALPFILHLLVSERSWWLRALILALIPAILVVILATDSRLGFVCFVSSIAAFMLLRAIITWRNRPTGIFAPAILCAYAAGAAMIVVLSLTWHRLEVLVWGGAAAQFSTQSRQVQMEIGLHKIMHNPFGYGFWRAGGVLDYIAPETDFVTIDSYYLAVALDCGVLGFLVYYGMFAWATGRAALAALRTRDDDVLYLAAAAVALLNFVISKSVYSQTENHPLAFILLGLVIALMRRHQTELGRLPSLADRDVVFGAVRRRKVGRY